jgi:hypothetical protein
MGAGINDPAARAKYATGLMALPGGAQMGAQAMQSLMSNQSMDQRTISNQIAEQEKASQTNIWKQLAAEKLAGVKQGIQDKKDRLRRGPFEDTAEYLTAQRGARGDYTKESAPFRNTLNTFNKLSDMVTNAGGFESMTGADDMNLIRGFIKMNNPGEAIMTDDQAQAQIAAGGYPGFLDSFIQQLEGSGSLSPPQRQELYQSLVGTAGSAYGDQTGVRGFYGGIAERNELDPRGIMQDRIERRPYQQQQVVPPTINYTPEQQAEIGDHKPGDQWTGKDGMLYQIDPATGRLQAAPAPRNKDRKRKPGGRR